MIFVFLLPGRTGWSVVIKSTRLSSVGDLSEGTMKKGMGERQVPPKQAKQANMLEHLGRRWRRVYWDDFPACPVLIGKTSRDLAAGKGDDLLIPMNLFVQPPPDHVRFDHEGICVPLECKPCSAGVIRG